MPFFVDTSALFKRYQFEKGSQKINQIIESHDKPLFISSITIIEVVSNLRRLYEIDHLTTEELFLAQRAFFFNDLRNLNITILDVTSEDILKAEMLIKKRYMKPIDSIQLAVALNIPVQNLTFLSSDQGLCKIAKTEGLLILNPER